MIEWIGKRLRAYAEKDGRGYPDWLMRYGPIVRRLRRHGLEGAAILEIGANENGFSRFSGLPVIALDINVAHLDACRRTQRVRPVVGDVAALPFRAGTFAVCVCVDTFEHLPEGTRYRAVDEIARILDDRGAAVVSFPSGAGASAAERRVREEYRHRTGNRLHWLEEHDREGLPSPDSICGRFREQMDGTYIVSVEKNANLLVWWWMWRIMLCGWPGRGNAVFQAGLRLTAPLLSRMHVGRCYRSIVWVEPGERTGGAAS